MIAFSLCPSWRCSSLKNISPSFPIFWSKNYLWFLHISYCIQLIPIFTLLYQLQWKSSRLLPFPSFRNLLFHFSLLRSKSFSNPTISGMFFSYCLNYECFWNRWSSRKFVILSSRILVNANKKKRHLINRSSVSAFFDSSNHIRCINVGSRYSGVHHPYYTRFQQ